MQVVYQRFKIKSASQLHGPKVRLGEVPANFALALQS
jgi:hypothetical protein